MQEFTDITNRIAESPILDSGPAAGARSPSDQVRELASIPPGATTEELLLRLLSALAAILDARRAYVTENFEHGMSRTIASWEGGKPGPVREYALSGTPCADVMSRGVQVVDCELARRYTLEELRALDSSDQLMTLECSGNGASKGFIGAVYNSKWTGTRLAPILEAAGVQPEAIEVVFM